MGQKRQRDTMYLSKEEIKKMLAKATTLVERTVLLVSYELALRVSEAVALKVSSFDFDSHICFVWDEKKDVIRKEAMTADVEAAVRLYISERRLKENDLLFPYSKKTLNRWVKRLSFGIVEYDKRYFNLRFHSLRHSRIRHWMEEKKGINFISAMTGDTPAVLYEVYGKLKVEDVVRIARGGEHDDKD